jgi:lipoprotein-anchoring transpeptidase ErfK/SrfK
MLLISVALAATPAKPHRRRGARPKPAPPAEVAIDPAAVNDAATTQTVKPRSAPSAVLRAQILLDRAHFSPGEIDGRYGANLAKAVAAFARERGLPVTDVVDATVWAEFDRDTAPALVTVEIAPETIAGPFTPEIPNDMDAKAKLEALNYLSPLEAIAEEFHSSPKLLQRLNPAATFDRAGEQILLPNVKVPPPGKAASVVVSRSDRSVAALDAQGHVLAWYPATIGSEHDPLPLGHWKIRGVSKYPPFHYNPELFWDAKPEDEKARIPPGPNNPVGVVWIDLSKDHYGIHGTPEPSEIGRTQSHGCIRLTNWDAWELASIVSPGTPAILQE